MKGALVIGGHIHGLSIVRSLGQAGVPVYIADRFNGFARYSKYCKAFFRCPEYDQIQFIHFLIDLCAKEKLYGWSLFLTDEVVMLNIAEHKTELQQYFKIIYPNKTEFENIFHKKKFLKIAEQVDIPIPRTWYAVNSDLIGFDLNFPVIVKANFGLDFWRSTGQKAYFAENETELKHILAKIKNLDDIFIQECLPIKNSRVHSFTAFCVDGKIQAYWSGLKIEEQPHPFGIATCAQSVESGELLKLSTPLLQALSYSGICECEFLRDKNNDFKLLEMNGRSWLWMELAISCGINYPVYMHNYLMGKKQHFPNVYKAGIYWFNLWYTLLLFIPRLLKKQTRFKYLFKLFRLSTRYAVFNFKDLIPFIRYTIAFPYYVKHI